MHRLKNILANNKSLVENFSYLTLFQVLTLVFPLLSYPYLIRVLGVVIYGKIIFAQAIVGYLVILITFGFNISATKEVSIHRDNKAKLSEIISSIFILKILLFCLSLLAFTPLLFFFNDAAENKLLFILTLWMCLSEILSFNFYFQGLEKMKYISVISFIVKLVSLLLIFVFIQTKSDYILVPVLYFIGAVVAGVLSIYILFYVDKIRFYIPSFSCLQYYFKESIPIFMSSVSIQIYVSTNKVFVGLFLGMAEVSYYDMAEKILNILRIPQGILSQTVFPKVSHDRNIHFIKKIFKYSLMLNGVLFIMLFIFAEKIIFLLGGTQMLPSKWVVIILGLTLPIVAISNIFGILVLIPFGYNKLFSKIIMFSGLIFILQFLFLWLTNLISVYSLCLTTVITELFVSFLMYYYCLKNNLWTTKSTTT